MYTKQLETPLVFLHLLKQEVQLIAVYRYCTGSFLAQLFYFVIAILQHEVADFWITHDLSIRLLRFLVLVHGILTLYEPHGCTDLSPTFRRPLLSPQLREEGKVQ